MKNICLLKKKLPVGPFHGKPPAHCDDKLSNITLHLHVVCRELYGFDVIDRLIKRQNCNVIRL